MSFEPRVQRLLDCSFRPLFEQLIGCLFEQWFETSLEQSFRGLMEC